MSLFVIRALLTKLDKNKLENNDIRIILETTKNTQRSHKIKTGLWNAHLGIFDSSLTGCSVF